jgi:hypothetical protein
MLVVESRGGHEPLDPRLDRFLIELSSERNSSKVHTACTHRAMRKPGAYCPHLCCAPERPEHSSHLSCGGIVRTVQIGTLGRVEPWNCSFWTSRLTWGTTSLRNCASLRSIWTELAERWDTVVESACLWRTLRPYISAQCLAYSAKQSIWSGIDDFARDFAFGFYSKISKTTIGLCRLDIVLIARFRTSSTNTRDNDNEYVINLFSSN